MTVGGVAGSSAGLLRGRFAPHVKQMRSSRWTSAAHAGQVRVAMSILRDGGRVCVHESLTRDGGPRVPGRGRAGQ